MPSGFELEAIVRPKVLVSDNLRPASIRVLVSYSERQFCSGEFSSLKKRCRAPRFVYSESHRANRDEYGIFTAAHWNPEFSQKAGFVLVQLDLPGLFIQPWFPEAATVLHQIVFWSDLKQKTRAPISTRLQGFRG